MNEQTKKTAILTVESLADGKFIPLLDINGRQFNFAMACESESDAKWFCEQMSRALDDAGCEVDLK